MYTDLVSDRDSQGRPRTCDCFRLGFRLLASKKVDVGAVSRKLLTTLSTYCTKLITLWRIVFHFTNIMKIDTTTTCQLGSPPSMPDFLIRLTRQKSRPTSSNKCKKYAMYICDAGFNYQLLWLVQNVTTGTCWTWYPWQPRCCCFGTRQKRSVHSQMYYKNEIVMNMYRI